MRSFDPNAPCIIREHSELHTKSNGNIVTDMKEDNRALDDTGEKVMMGMDKLDGRTSSNDTSDQPRLSSFSTISSRTTLLEPRSDGPIALLQMTLPFGT